MFDGAIAIVTGGASGIGKAIASALTQAGAQVTIADRQEVLGFTVAEELNSKPNTGDVRFVQTDVSDYEQVAELIHQTHEGAQRLDFLFNNAGVSVGGYVSDYNHQDWSRVLSVNLDGVVNGIQAAYPIMQRQGSGHIVNIASLAGLIPSPMNVAYTASKHAVIGLSRALRPEASTYGVKVNVVCPGVVRTPMLKGGGKYGRMATTVPEDVVAAAWEAASPMAPEACAEQILAGVAANREIIFAPHRGRLAWWIERAAPSLLTRRGFATLSKKLNQEDQSSA